MGNSFSTPESMKNLPNELNKDEYIKITTKEGNNFYVFSRTFMGRLKGDFKQDWSAQNIGLGMMGNVMGVGNQLSSINQSLNQQEKSRYYITTSPNPKSDPIQSSVDDYSLKGYIKLFKMDPIVNDKFKFDLETSIFELKKMNEKQENQKEQLEKKEKKENNTFGKTKKMNNLLKRLKADLKKVL